MLLLGVMYTPTSLVQPIMMQSVTCGWMSPPCNIEQPSWPGSHSNGLLNSTVKKPHFHLHAMVYSLDTSTLAHTTGECPPHERLSNLLTGQFLFWNLDSCHMPKFGELFSLTLLLKLCFHKELNDSLTHKKLVLNTNYSQLIETASLCTFVSNQT